MQIKQIICSSGYHYFVSSCNTKAHPYELCIKIVIIFHHIVWRHTYTVLVGDLLYHYRCLCMGKIDVITYKYVINQNKSQDINIEEIHIYFINVRENRRGNQQWTIQRNWQHWVHQTQRKTQHNIYVLDTTIHRDSNNVNKTSSPTNN